MGNAKEAVRDILDRLSDDSTFEDIMYHIYVQEKVQHGLDDVREGRLLSQEEVEKRMSRWLGK
jgi:predicted transcriptional regulator